MTTVLAPVIGDDVDLTAALARVEVLWGSPVGSPNGDELDVLITLVREYESRHYPIAPPTPIEAVTGLMDRLQLARRDLLPIFGTHARISEFLAGKRPLSKSQIKGLHETYGIPYESLMG
jgi:HTH-type transcriptional regulator/antitoxin HigA